MGIDIDIDCAPFGALVTENIEAVDRFQGSFGHPDGGCVDFGCPVVILRTPFPDPEIRCSIRPEGE